MAHEEPQRPGDPVALDFTRSPGTWTRAERARLAAQLHPAKGTAEGARRLGVSTSTVREYLRDPDGAAARARRSGRPAGICARCGAGVGAPRGARRFRLCPACAAAARASWTTTRVIEAYRCWQARFGYPPTSTDWSRTHAVRRGGASLERHRSGRWPTSSTIARLYGGWPQLVAAAGQSRPGQDRRSSERR
jgi:hypothetical protein